MGIYELSGATDEWIDEFCARHNIRKVSEIIEETQEQEAVNTKRIWLVDESSWDQELFERVCNAQPGDIIRVPPHLRIIEVWPDHSCVISFDGVSEAGEPQVETQAARKLVVTEDGIQPMWE